MRVTGEFGDWCSGTSGVASEVELSNERGQRSSEGQVMQKGGSIFDALVLA